MSDCGCEMEARNAQERKTLLIVLMINAAMFVFEFGLGWLAQSTGLVADSLDMLADASVYAISLYAIGRSERLKHRAARYSGLLQIGLALLVLVDVLRRFLLGSEPVSGLMMLVGAVALVANVTCLRLIMKHRDSGVHMRASLIFSANDVIANIGVMLSGVLVWWLGSRLPDLLIGLVIALLVLRGGVRILQDAAAAARTPEG
ncbi:cation diffusion facilitator family transporter [Marinobacterium halophilum]|uniref:Cation diffusion facilitator family transporter n=1 Tax=Marinobacterium halophilum TaxID=267374 RepID=A0A2P8ELA3_9GAMM|nr:cation transporter [Marinobacterium halophilum]PSL10255.1 cation diffusion facilitator family transporter [Marinobacterium halophilum]